MNLVVRKRKVRKMGRNYGYTGSDIDHGLSIKMRWKHKGLGVGFKVDEAVVLEAAEKPGPLVEPLKDLDSALVGL